MSLQGKDDPIPSAFQEVWKDLDATRPLLSKELEAAEVYWDTQTRRSHPAPITRWSSVMPMAMGAVAAVMVMSIWWWFAMGVTPSQYHTAKGEQQTITLNDGSTVMLNTNTKLSVRLSDHERLIELEQGEAWFRVTHDSNRPFQVEAGNGRIVDLGTQFIVKKTIEKVDVSVLEGRVEVDVTDLPNSSLSASPRMLQKGDQVWYTSKGHLSAIESFNEQAASAWREGKLIFHAKPLDEVLKELARYTTGKIELLDPTLAELPISGIFNIQDLESFPQALQEAFPIKATPLNPTHVVLERSTKS